jgi:glycine C-acetyltransferase/8-amino-7-oxononanoate synthase
LSNLSDEFIQKLRKLRESGALKGSFADFQQVSGKNLEKRTMDYYQWRGNRMKHGVWSFATQLQSGPEPEITVVDEAGKQRRGLNFASVDYLGLVGHPAVRAAAVEAIQRYGTHIASAPVLQGNSTLSLRLQDAVSEMLGLAHVLLFPTGWAAGYGVITALIRSKDHVVLDQYAHDCCVQGAISATRNVHRVRHLSTDAFVRRLRHIRATDSQNAILVVTEGLFSMDGDSPDLQALQSVCREYEATLLVDVAHDLGAFGPGGTGAIGLQDLVGKVDLVIGSFSKVFASNGGFLATPSGAIREYVRPYAHSHTFSNAISPSSCAAALTAIEIVRSAEGELLREKLRGVADTLRESLTAAGLVYLGKGGPIVPVLLEQEELGRITAALCFDRGVFGNLIEYPAVSRGACRLRMQVMATHTTEQARSGAKVVGSAYQDAKEILDRPTGAGAGTSV